MIRAIIFDIGNVLLKFDYEIAYERLRPDCTIIGDDVYPSAYTIRQAYERGEMGRGDFLERVREVLRHGGSEAHFIEAWEQIFEVNEPMIELVRQLRGQLPLYLLSNISDLHTDYLSRTYPFFEWFDGAVYSYVAGALKPEPEIYAVAVEGLGVPAEQILFVDDREENIRGAEAAGMLGIVYRSHAEFLVEMERRGFLKLWGA